jgi:hypothetical protein
MTENHRLKPVPFNRLVLARRCQLPIDLRRSNLIIFGANDWHFTAFSQANNLYLLY